MKNMKKNYLLTIVTILFCTIIYGQNAVVGTGFSSGWNGGCGFDTSSYTYFSASAGSSYISTLNANGTGDQYFRFGIDWGGTISQLTTIPGSDSLLSTETEYSLSSTCTTSGAMYINVSSTSDNYIFKTKNAGSSPTGNFIVFQVQGVIRTASSISTPSITYPGQTNTITATLDGSLPTGQGVYMRYSTDNFANSTVVEMTGAGTSYTANIPSGTNTVSANVSYYIFTSGSGLTISPENADFYAINLNNNTGTNYNYTVSSSYASKADGNWSDSATWMNNSVPDTSHEVVIENDVTLNQDDTVVSITVSATKSLTLNETHGITISGNLTNNGTITAKSGSSLMVGGTSTGNITYNVAVNDTNWHLISSPVVGEQYDDTWVTNNSIESGLTNTDNRGIATYQNGTLDGTTGPWTYFQTGGTAATFGAGVGYSLKRTGSGNYTFTGTFPTTDISPAISQDDNNWNLIGNPYPSYINIATFISDNTANIGAGAFQAIYVWNAGTNDYDDLTTGHIHPGQAFFINSDVASGTASISEAMQSHQTGITFYKNADTSIELSLSNGTNSKKTKINYLDGKTTSLDPGFDIGMFDGVSSDLSLYTNLVNDNEGIAFARQALPNSDLETMVIPIGIIADAGEITFSAETVNFPSELKVFLEDRQNNTFTRLDEANSNYAVTLTEKTEGISRFYLHTNSSALIIDNIQLENISIYKTNASTLRIVGLSQGKTNLKLFNILGKQVLKTSFKSNGVSEISLPKLATGVYIAQLENEAGKLNKKIVLE